MSVERRIAIRTKRRVQRVRARLSRDLPRVSVFRSLNHIYAQISDGAESVTLASASTLELKDTKGSKKDLAHAVGVALAQKAQSKGIKAASFDRGAYIYHGRVKALAEGLRAGGLQV